jgi:hypothetical protein
LYYVSQKEKECSTRETNLERYLALIRRMECYFKDFIVEHIERTKNAKDDELVKVAARNTPLPADIFFQVTSNASIKTFRVEHRVIKLIEGEDWHTSIMAYLHHYYEPDNVAEHTRMQQ